MSNKFKIVESNQLGEIIEREMTAAEKEDYLADVQRLKNLKELEIAEEQAKVNAKTEILKKLGLSTEEVEIFLA